ncbi:MAB_1171c family putative transporter [Streptomyces sp. NPDC001817]|uniref:MAB_1171c family putative transporter n=1 Tax=Streptomyces sp. NPDC001817 TaxID=3154398 RepID=UPI003322F1F3
MSDLLAYLIAGLLLIQAGLRAKSAVRGHARDRSLWGAFVAFAAAWLSRTSAGITALDSLDVPDLAYFVKHVLSIIGICVILRYVTAVYRTAGPDGERSRAVRLSALVHRVATRASVATVLVMGVIFFFLLGKPDTATPFFIERYRGQAALAVYMGLFYLYAGVAAAVCAVQWGGAVKDAPFRSLRNGLRMMSTAMVITTVYSVIRIAFLAVVTFSRVSDGTEHTQETVTDTLLYLCFLLWGLGAIAPATHAARERYHALRSLVDLHPLWRQLALRFPDAVRHRPSTYFTRITAKAARLDALRDVLFSPDPSLPARLDRFAMDIRDAVFLLRRHAPHDLAERALARAGTDLGPEHATEVQAEALWIRAALSTADEPTHEPAGVSAPYPFDPGATPDDEVTHLRDLASAYRLTTPADAEDLLTGEFSGRS